MKLHSLMMVGIAVFLLAGCGARKGSSANKLPADPVEHDYFSKTPQGKDAALRSGAPVAKKVDNPDYESYGLKMYPGSKPDKDNTAHIETGKTVETVRFRLLSDDPVTKVTAFYEKELGVKASIASTTDALISGNVDDDHSALVTVYVSQEGKTLIDVQILEDLTN